MTTRPGRFSEIDPEECWNLLDTTTVGRLGFTTDDGVVVLPVNFIVFESAVYVRTDPHTVIAKLAEGSDNVAFEVDHLEDMFQRGWSVLLRGSTAEADSDEATRALESSTRLGPWAPGDRPLVIKLTPRAVSGRRVSLH
jgi:nitroimidazol reductase NimA-like FMN-containing flavoprotein (pyridoxamine 5'-phosphate oxidase superfamily)